MPKIRITPLFHGNMHADRDLLLTGHPAGLLSRDGRHKNKVWCEVPSFTYLIEHPDGRLLFDAAISRHWEDEWLPHYKDLAPYDEVTEEQMFEQALKRAGYGPEDIDYVFLSHLHCDHAGNARLFKSAHSTLLVGEKEFTAAANREADGEFFLRADYDIPGARFTLLPGDTEILKGVTAVSLPGHTAGTMALMVDTENCGTLILASDACYFKESYDDEVGSMVSADLVEWKRSMRKLKMLARSRNATVVPGHDHRLCHEGQCPIGEEPRLRVAPRYYD